MKIERHPSAPDTEQATVQYTGELIIPTPGLLIFDQELNDAEKILWQMLLVVTQDGREKQLPSQSEIATYMNKTRQTISQYLQVLRTCRWISIIEEQHLSSTNLKPRYKYLVHGKKLSFTEAVSYDNKYIPALINNSHADNIDVRLRRLSVESLRQDRHDVLQLMGKARLSDLETDTLLAVLDVRTPDVKKPDTEASADDIYNARTQIGINNKVINNISVAAASSRKLFDFFEHDEMQALREHIVGKYQNQTAHAIYNHLKKQCYVLKDKATGERKEFRHVITQAEAEAVLVKLLHEPVSSVINFTTTLIYQASQGELSLSSHQAAFFHKLRFGEQEALEKQSALSQKQAQMAAEHEAIQAFWQGRSLHLSDQFVDKHGNLYVFDPAGNLRPDVVA